MSVDNYTNGRTQLEGTCWFMLFEILLKNKARRPFSDLLAYA